MDAIDRAVKACRCPECDPRWCGAMTGLAAVGLALATLALVAAMAWRIHPLGE